MANIFNRITGWSVWSALKPVTKSDLNQAVQKIVMTQQELAAQLTALNAKVQKIGTETAATLQKVIDLEAIIAAGGDVTPEVQDALTALKNQAQVTDDMVPDAPSPTPPTP